MNDNLWWASVYEGEDVLKVTVSSNRPPFSGETLAIVQCIGDDERMAWLVAAAFSEELMIPLDPARPSPYQDIKGWF